MPPLGTSRGDGPEGQRCPRRPGCRRTPPGDAPALRRSWPRATPAHRRRPVGQVLEEPHEFLQRERLRGGLCVQPIDFVSVLRRHREDQVGVGKIVASEPASRVGASVPYADATSIASMVAGSPSWAIVPAEDTSGADGPTRSVNILPRTAAAKGDRHRLPEHTTRIDATTSG